MGSSNTDYSKQINTALQQSNTPKSPLSQEYSNLLGSGAPDIMRALLNVQSLGNSFINSNGNGGGYTPTNPSVGKYNPNPLVGTQAQPGQFAGPTLGANGPNPNFNYSPTGGFSAVQNGGSANSGPPNINGYSGGFTPSYSNIGGVDLSQYLGKGLRMSDLINQGVLSQDQVNKQFGFTGDYKTDPNTQQSYQDYLSTIKSTPGADQSKLPDFETWYNSIGGLNATGLDAYTPNDPAGLKSAFASQTPQPGDGYINSSGQYVPGNHDPSQAQYLQNGYRYDAAGNIISGPSGNGGNGGMGGSSVNTVNGLPNGISAPGAQQTYGGNIFDSFNQLAQLVSRSAGSAGAISGLNNPQALQAVGNNGGASLNNTDIGSALQQLLATVGKSGFNQQNISPQSATSTFNPTTANLSSVPNSTSLSPETSQGFDAISQLINQQLGKNVADTRERAISTGTGRSTGESYDEATLKAQSLPQLASALESLRTQEVGNQLNQAGLQQQGLLANAGMQNQYGLGGAQLDTSTQLQNISNYINSINSNNQTALTARGQDTGTLGTLLNTQLGQNSQQLQNFFSSISALQNQLGIQNQYQSTANSAGLGQAGLLGGIGQSNAQQANTYNLGTTGMNQQAAQFQISNQLQTLMQLFNGGLGLASQGIPGGGANVNIGNTPTNGNGIGGNLAGLGSLLQALGSFK